MLRDATTYYKVMAILWTICGALSAADAFLSYKVNGDTGAWLVVAMLDIVLAIMNYFRYKESKKQLKL